MKTLIDQLNLDKKQLGTVTGQDFFASSKKQISSLSPVDNQVVGVVTQTSQADYQRVVALSKKAASYWRNVPAPQRGQVVRSLANILRQHKAALGALVSYEMGKSFQEGQGEVQEMIDICDFAVGLSRQLCGQTMHSERTQHRMYEQWQPLGVIGIITAFNFPLAVWAWNAAIAAVAGNVSIWKPSEKTPMVAIAMMHLLKQVVIEHQLPEGVFNLVVGDPLDLGETMIADPNLALISATGSCRMGRRVAEVVASRFGKVILELGGNNAVIVSDKADLTLAIPAIFFGAVGTAGQRCTTTRRVIIHDSCYDQVKQQLLNAYQSVRVGDPLDEKHHMGPLIDESSVNMMQEALACISKQGGTILFGGECLKGEAFQSNCYVRPALVEAPPGMAIVQDETFAPILYLIRYKGGVEEAIAIQNDVKQGLSSAIFTESLRESEIFLSMNGSDCGLANVNIGTSGAEIGGAFGGEKETGGGRESGSDAWKAYMRRQTNTINFSGELPLAQGITFEL